MFNFNDFIVENLTKGYANNSFTEEQINIFAMNYLSRGQITQETFDDILEEVLRINIERLEEEEELSENAVVEPPMVEATEEVEEEKVDNEDNEV